MEQLVNFAYSGRVRVTSQNVQSLLVGASFLQLQSICDACCQYLQSRLQGSNVLTVRQFASALGCDGLVQAADRFIQKHFTVVCRTDEFLQLAIEDLENILQRDELYVNSEEPIYEAAMVSPFVTCSFSIMTACSPFFLSHGFAKILLAEVNTLLAYCAAFAYRY